MSSQNRNQVDLLDYIRGQAGRRHRLSSGEIVQTIHQNNQMFIIQKNENWEHIGYDNQWIYRGLDTSPKPGEFYIISRDGYYHENKGVYGGYWVRRFMTVGSKVTSEQFVTHYREGNPPTPYHSGSPTYAYRLAALHNEWNAVNDVIELHWLVGDRVQEVYYYAKGWGFVGWNNTIFAGEISQFPKPLKRLASGFNYEELNMNLSQSSSRPIASSAKPDYVSITVTEVWNNDHTNVREMPSTVSNILGTIKIGDEIQIDLTTRYQVWRRVIFNGKEAWVGGRMSYTILNSSEAGGGPVVPPVPPEDNSIQAQISRLSYNQQVIQRRIDEIYRTLRKQRV